MRLMLAVIPRLWNIVTWLINKLHRAEGMLWFRAKKMAPDSSTSQQDCSRRAGKCAVKLQKTPPQINHQGVCHREWIGALIKPSCIWINDSNVCRRVWLWRCTLHKSTVAAHLVCSTAGNNGVSGSRTAAKFPLSFVRHVQRPFFLLFFFFFATAHTLKCVLRGDKI